ncbi:MAG TPA: MFS transporter [Gammaproteobacteria bacterium]|nr:MFS transporter [Gammaproteobacteria bacterium]
MISTRVIKSTDTIRLVSVFAVFLAALFYCYESLLRVAPSVISSELMNHYKIDAYGFGVLNSFYYYVYAPMQIPVGLLMDRYGPKKLLTFACFLCAIGTYFFICSHNLHLAQFGRVCVGLGSSFAFVGVLNLGSKLLPSNYFGLVTGATVTLGMLGAVMADRLLISIVSKQGWQLALYESTFIGFVLMVLLYTCIKDMKSQCNLNMSVDFKMIIKGVLKLVRSKNVWCNAIIGLSLWMPLAIFAEFVGVDFIRTNYHLTHSQAGIANSYFFIGWAIAAPFTALLSDRLRSRRIPMFGMSILAFVLSLVIISARFHFSSQQISLLLMLFGMSCSSQILIFPVSKELSCRYTSASALALTNMVTMLSGFLQSFCGKMVHLSMISRIGAAASTSAITYQAADYQYGAYMVPVFILIGIISVLFLKETYDLNTDNESS